MGNACSREGGGDETTRGRTKQQGNTASVTTQPERRPTLINSSYGQTQKEDGESTTTKPTPYSEDRNSASNHSASPPSINLKHNAIEESKIQEAASSNNNLLLSENTTTTHITSISSIPAGNSSLKPPVKYNGTSARGSFVGGSSMAGVNYMLETGGASRSGFGASASTTKDRNHPRRRRKAQAGAPSVVANVMAKGFGPGIISSPDSVSASPTSAAATPTQNLPRTALLSPAMGASGSVESGEMIEDTVSMPASNFSADTSLKNGATQSQHSHSGAPSLRPLTTSGISLQDPNESLGAATDKPSQSGGVSARSSESDHSRASGSRGASGSDRRRVTSFVASPLSPPTQSPSSESQPHTTTDDEDASMLAATLGEDISSKPTSKSTTADPSPNLYSVTKQGNSAFLRGVPPPVELPPVIESSRRGSTVDSIRAQQTTAPNSALNVSHTPAFLLRTAEAGNGMLSTLRSIAAQQQESLPRAASAVSTFAKKSPASTATNSQHESLSSFKQSLVEAPIRKSISKVAAMMCCVCRDEPSQFYCVECTAVDNPFQLCEDCFHCLDDSAHNPSHRYEVIDGAKFAAEVPQARSSATNDIDDDDDMSDYTTSDDENDEDGDFIGAAAPETPTALFDPCSSCGTQRYDGTIYRCRECAGYILCERCFTNGRYKHVASHQIQAVIHSPQVLNRRRKSGDYKRVITATKKDSSHGTHDEGGNRIINNYVVIKEIGRGSYARVRLLQHMESKELFAVKVLRRELLGSNNATNHSAASTPQHGGIGSGSVAAFVPLSIGSQSSSLNVNHPSPPFQQQLTSHNSYAMSGSLSAPPIAARTHRHSSLCSESEFQRQIAHTVMDSLREIAVLKLIDHPNVVKLVEVIDDEEGGKVYLIMEYLEGGCIHNLGEPPLNAENLFNFTTDILASLLHMHSLMLYHQDVKPANCLLTKNGVAKIADFGTCDSRHKVNVVKGTPAFLSPELVLGQETTGAMVDAWAFGVTLYQAASGELPFPITSMYAFNQAITSPQPVEIPQAVSDSDLRDLLALLLEKDIRKRYNLIQTAEHPFYTRGADSGQGKALIQANMVHTPRYAYEDTTDPAWSVQSHSYQPGASALSNEGPDGSSFANSRSDLLDRAGSLILKGFNVGRSFHGQSEVEKQLKKRAIRELRKNSDSIHSGEATRRSSERRKSSVTVLSPRDEKSVNSSISSPQNYFNATTLTNAYLDHVDSLEHKMLNLANAIIYKDSFLQAIAQAAPTLRSLHCFKNISLSMKVIKSINWSSFKNLTRLRISSCDLTTFPLEILFGTYVEKSEPLHIDSNCTSARGVNEQNSTNVETGAPLSPNGGEAAHFPAGCPCIEKLDLSYNFIEEIPEVINEYRPLISLNMEGNSICSFPSGKVFKSKSLKRVNLSGNVLRSLPQEGLVEAAHGVQLSLDDHPNLKEEWARAVVTHPSLRTITVLWTGIYPKQPVPAIAPQLLIGTLEQTLYFGSVRSELNIKHFVVPSMMVEEFERLNKFSNRVMAADASTSHSSLGTGLLKISSPEARSPRHGTLSESDNGSNPSAALIAAAHPLQVSTNTAAPNPSSIDGSGSNHFSSSNHSSTMAPPHPAAATTQGQALFNMDDLGTSSIVQTTSVNTNSINTNSVNTNMTASSVRASSNSLPNSNVQSPHPFPRTILGKRTHSTSIPAEPSPFAQSKYSHFAVTSAPFRRRSHRLRLDGSQSSTVNASTSSKRHSSSTHNPTQPTEGQNSLSVSHETVEAQQGTISKSQTAAFNSSNSQKTDSQRSTNSTINEVISVNVQKSQPSGNSMAFSGAGSLLTTDPTAVINTGATLVPTATMFIESPRCSPSPRSLVEPDVPPPPANNITTSSVILSHTSLDHSIDSLNSNQGGPTRTVVKVLDGNKPANSQYQHMYHGMHCFTSADVSSPNMEGKDDMKASGSNSTSNLAGSNSTEPALLRYLVEYIVHRREPVLILLDPSRATRSECALVAHCTRLLLVEHFGLSPDSALEAVRSCGVVTAAQQAPILWSPEVTITTDR